MHFWQQKKFEKNEVDKFREQKYRTEKNSDVSIWNAHFRDSLS